MADHYTGGDDEGRFARDVEDARKLHHLATADPEVDRKDGTLTGPAHEDEYGLERAKGSAEQWRGQGVHPIENRALVEGEDGAENLRGIAAPGIETADAPKTTENASAPRASDSSSKS